MNRWIATLAAAAALSAPAAAQTFVFDLRGSQESPPVSSAASGGCFGELDQPGAQFSITCVHDVVNATVMHIHRGAPGVNGPIAFDLGDPSSSPVTATWTSMTPADVAELLAGNLYVNIHTAGRPSGEIRGQILSRTVDLVEFTADGAQVVPPNESSATASCTADLDGPATSLAIQCTHDVPGATSAHIHEAPLGLNGPIVFTFSSPASPLDATMPMTPVLVADFAATFLYLDIHGVDGGEGAPSDDIRGQIGTPPAGAGSGTIHIEKQTSPSGGSGFGFTESITPGIFTLDDGGTETFAGVAPGTYTVTEDDPSSSGFTLAGLSCNDANSSGDVNSRTATINVEAGETVRCTFRNLETSPTDTIFVFHLSGDQEVPPLVTPERGGCMGRFDAGASELSLVCTHDVDLATVMHIHRAPAGANGPIVFDLGTPASPVIVTWSGMTPGDVADLFAGNFYVNIHTAGRPAGAIRGQILTRTVDTVAFTADASQVVPPGTTPATANCTADLDAPATALAISCTHDLPTPDVAHVHQAPRGANGPIAFTFPSAASPIAANMPLTPRLVADFAAHFLYLDIHGPDGGEAAPADEIRGQIAPPVIEPTTGTIVIRKATSPAGGAAFAFTETITPGGFVLDDGGEQVFAGVSAGTYTITEESTPGWSLTDVTCSDDDSTGDPAASTATVSLQGGETVSCTFTNLQSVVAPSHFVLHLSGDQEVPPSGSTSRGGCYGQLDTILRRLSLVCTHNVTGPTLTHIHHGVAGVNGPVVFDLGSPTSPIEATWDMSPEEMDLLLAGELYVNIHTGGRPEGEIRGQLLERTVDRMTFPVDGSQEVPPTDSTATGDCLADLADDPASLFLQCTHDVVGATSIHLHTAPPGFEGPIVSDLPLANDFAADVPLTPRFIADFAAGFLYVNVHSTDFPEGEIRGQVLGPGGPGPADLSVTKNSPGATYAPGSPIPYTITLENIGPNFAFDVTLTDVLPPDTTFASLTAPAGFSCATPAEGSGGTVTCTTATLAPGTSTFTLVVTVSSSATGSISNTVSVTTTSPDPDATNDEATETDTLVIPVATADLSVTKTSSQTSYVPGTTITYAITLENAGPDPAADVTLTDVIPANTTFASLTAPAGFTCATPAEGSAGTVTCMAATLGVGTSTFTLIVNVSSSATGSISNTATVTAASADPTPGNDAGTNTMPAGAAPAAIPTLDVWAMLMLALLLATAQWLRTK